MGIVRKLRTIAGYRQFKLGFILAAFIIANGGAAVRADTTVNLTGSWASDGLPGTVSFSYAPSVSVGCVGTNVPSITECSQSVDVTNVTYTIGNTAITYTPQPTTLVNGGPVSGGYILGSSTSQEIIQTSSGTSYSNFFLGDMFGNVPGFPALSVAPLLIVTDQFGVSYPVSDPATIINQVYFTPGSPDNLFNSYIDAYNPLTSVVDRFNVAPGSPTSTACQADINNAVNRTLGTGKSASGLSYDIAATFSPNNGVSLQQAEADCGVTNFDWQQTITTNGNNILATASDPTTTPIATPFFDPPFNGYFNTALGMPQPIFCTSNPPSPYPAPPFLWTLTDPSEGNPSPFYLDPNSAVPSSDCDSLLHNETATTLSFMDSPANFTGALSAFTTCLVGVSSTDGLVPLPSSNNDCFNWTDTYTGLPCATAPTLTPNLFVCEVDANGTGGISVLESLVSYGEPGLGTGGIELVSVPEPNSLIIGVTEVFFFLVIVKRRKRLYLFKGHIAVRPRQTEKSQHTNEIDDKGIFQKNMHHLVCST